MNLNQKKIQLILLFAALLIVPIKNMSQGTQVKSEDVKNFLDESGIMHQIKEIPLIISEQFEAEASRFEPETRAKIRAAIIDAFQEEQLVSDAISFILADVQQAQISHIMDWLERPLTQKMNQLELIASSEEVEELRNAYFMSLEDNPPPQTRIDIILDFDDLTNTTDHTVFFISDLYLTLIQAMNPFLPVHEQVSRDDLEVMREMIIREMYNSYKNVTVMMNLFTYREVSDRELLEYIDYYRTPSGSWFASISYGVFDHILTKANDRIRSGYGIDN